MIITTTVAAIVFVAIVWMFREAIVGYFSLKDSRASRHLKRVEQTREYFACIRHRLLDLAFEGKVSPESETFRFLYQLLTTIMRRPDQYEVISQVLLSELVGHAKGDAKKQDTSFAAERDSWTPELKALFAEISEGLMMVIVEFSGILRAFYRWANRDQKQTHLEFILQSLALVRKRIEEEKKKTSKEFRVIYKAQGTFKTLSTV